MGRFFDALGKKAGDLFNKAQTAVEEGCERFQLCQDIQQHKDSLQKLFAELGRLTYHGNAELAGVRPKPDIVADITAACEKLVALEAQLEEMSVPKEEPDIKLDIEPTAGRFCHKCGTPQDEDDLFCNKCGTKLK